MIPVPSPAGSVTELRFLRSTLVERQLRPVQIHYKVDTDKISYVKGPQYGEGTRSKIVCNRLI